MTDRDKELKRLVLKVLKNNIDVITIPDYYQFDAFKNGFGLNITDFRIDIVQENDIDVTYKKQRYRLFPFLRKKVEHRTLEPKFWFIEFEDRKIQISRVEYEEIEKMYKDYTYKKQVEQLKNACNEQ